MVNKNPLIVKIHDAAMKYKEGYELYIDFFNLIKDYYSFGESVINDEEFEIFAENIGLPVKVVVDLVKTAINSDPIGFKFSVQIWKQFTDTEESVLLELFDLFQKYKSGNRDLKELDSMIGCVSSEDSFLSDEADEDYLTE
jgi:hypothetical protein